MLSLRRVRGTRHASVVCYPRSKSMGRGGGTKAMVPGQRCLNAYWLTVRRVRNRVSLFTSCSGQPLLWNQYCVTHVHPETYNRHQWSTISWPPDASTPCLRHKSELKSILLAQWSRLEGPVPSMTPWGPQWFIWRPGLPKIHFKDTAVGIHECYILRMHNMCDRRIIRATCRTSSVPDYRGCYLRVVFSQELALWRDIKHTHSIKTILKIAPHTTSEHLKFKKNISWEHATPLDSSPHSSLMFKFSPN